MQKRARVPCGRALSRARLATNVDGFARYASFYIARRRIRVLRVCFLHRPAMILRTAHAFASSPMISCAMLLHHSPTVSRATRVLFTSNGGDFTHCARFYIARRRFRAPCALLHRAPTVSRATRVLFTSPGGDFTRHASFYIARRRFRTPCVLYIARRRFRVLRVCFLHRTAVISHTAHAFASSPMISCATLLYRPATDSHAMRPFTSHGDDFTLCTRAFYIARRRFRSSCVLLHERKGEYDFKGSDF